MKPGSYSRPVPYFAAGFDSAYYLYPYPYQRLAIRSAIDRVASSPPPVEVKAPMCVHSTVMRQTKDAERLVVHLFNDSNTTAHHAMPVDDVPLREETLPIHEIRVTFSASYPIGRVHLEPEGIDLPVKVEASGAQSVIVPRLDVHSMVVVGLKGANPK